MSPENRSPRVAEDLNRPHADVFPDLEHRAVLELRAESSKIVGYAVVFDTRSRDLGGFVEVVRADAVNETANVVALFNHDPNAVLGRTPATLQLRKDTRGLAFTLDPAPTQAGRDALTLVTRGDVTGASFGFRTRKDHWRKESNLMVRELLDIDIAEISLTAFPAYRETDVSVAKRSLQKQAGSSDLQPSIQWLRMQARVR